jgi:hypothetical protein
MTCCSGKWKGFKHDKKLRQMVPKFISLPGNYRPLVINPQSIDDISISDSLLKSNQFKGRPLKHWRKQYGNDNNRQSNHSRNLIQQYNTPGGSMVQDTLGKTSMCDCSGNVLGFPDYTLGEYHTNACKYNGLDDASHAIRRTRNGYNVNPRNCNASDVNRQHHNRYISYHQYNHARCKEYNQNMNGDLRYADSPKTCPCSCGSDEKCLPENISQSCRKRAWDKPNNKQFWQQGAVSSGSRILRLKLNTINTTANSIGVAYGKGSANALTYNGNTETPFITKSKMNAGGYALRSGPHASKYPVDADLYYRYLTNKKLWKGQNSCVKDCL